ncbi:MAG: 23S rRNA (uracil(1939)-C(5))-methyltransferase RlmD [Pseudohongiellaceae bacterium]
MSRRQRRQALPAGPVTVSIDGLSHEGRGVARIDGKVAFVDGALPGETVEARYTGSRRQFDELRTLDVIEASPQRVTPPCEWFGICGGCAMQHLAPEEQREHKQSVLLEHLRHQAGLGVNDFRLLPPMSGVSDINYRRKARLAVRHVRKKGGTLVGFREKASTFITDMQDCRVLVPAVSDLIAPLRALFSDMKAGAAIPQVEVAAGEPADSPEPSQVALVLRHLAPLPEVDREALRAFANAYGVRWYLQSGGPRSVMPLDSEEGESRLYYRLPDFDLRMAFHPMDFTQVNGDINRRMVGLAIELLDLSEGHRVLDLFCGLGNFTLAAARHCAAVHGVEGSSEMVQRGYENASLNDIDNVTFQAADLTGDVREQDWTRSTWDRVLLDPPRSGAAELISLIGELKPEKVVYISCNPVTLARDAALLVAQGYYLEQTGIMDMFPHTAHVESIARFIRIPQS